MTKLTPTGLKGLLKKPGRHADGQGLYFRTVGDSKAYWVYRFRINRREREMSLGAFPEVTLAEARAKHAGLRKTVIADKVDSLAQKNAAKTVQAATDTPTFGKCADQHIATNEDGWKNPKHARLWSMTLTVYCKPIRDMPVDQIATADVLACLKPIWNEKPETASRLRGRIEAVIASAQVDGWIPEDRPNPARWKNWLDRKLPEPKKIAPVQNHASMPYADLPAFMARLGASSNTAAKALMLTILAASRTSEVLNATWDEVNFDTATWVIPKERMKMGREHAVPLSDPALAVLRGQEARRGKNPHIFPGRPMRPLSNMSMAMLMRRFGAAEFTVHGFRSSFRMWCSDVAHIEFEVAEQCVAHAVGNAASKAYNRSSLLERRRPVMVEWGRYVCGQEQTAKIISLATRRG